MKANNVSYTVRNQMCTGCGVCQGACRKGAISFIVKKGTFRPTVDNSICNKCGLCLRACPGVGINLVEKAKELFTDSNTREHKLIGRYLTCFAGYSEDTELRANAASGGVLSQFLIWLLENDKIDGALVTHFDKNEPFKEKSIIASKKEEILSAKGSKYAPVSFNEAVRQIKEFDGSRIVVVGLPCHIQGFRKLIEFDKKVREKVVGLFSLFCSGTQTFYYTKYILSNAGIKTDDLQYLAYREGDPTGMVAKTSSIEYFKEYKKYNRPLKATFYSRRCLLCVDMFGELADINFGDIYTENPKEAGVGINAIITRSNVWQNLLVEAQHAGAISLTEITEARMLNKRPMAKEKKSRNASFVKLLKVLHLAYPIYDSEYDTNVKTKTLARYCIMRFKQFVGKNQILWFLLPKIK